MPAEKKFTYKYRDLSSVNTDIKDKLLWPKGI